MYINAYISTMYVFIHMYCYVFILTVLTVYQEFSNIAFLVICFIIKVVGAHYRIFSVMDCTSLLSLPPRFLSLQLVCL